MKKRLSKLSFKKAIAILALVFIGWAWLDCLPSPLFKAKYSTAITDNKGVLLSARVADDGQWRFPASGMVPEKVELSLLHFEDRHFYRHPGINPWAILRAAYLNIKNRNKTSGGSTLTMQTIRLARNNPGRTYTEKLVEMIWSLRLELACSKKEILNIYAAHAPFGGNVVGLEAASWRYFGRPSASLSWAEAASLAVLPNAPGLIFPGKNHEKLLEKRNKLLDKLLKYNIIDEETNLLAKQEALPEKPFPLPQKAKHLLNRASNEGHKGKMMETTIDRHLQDRVNETLERHFRILLSNGINNAAALVLDVETGETLAYGGNIPFIKGKDDGHDVDIITAPRSTGSTLKPFLFAAMLHEGEILPEMLVADIPTNIGGYYPKNYTLSFDGVVPAKRAIARSLNVPAVRMLHEYGIEKFIYKLRKFGLKSIDKDAGHYGLSLILGGAESTLWELAGAYASMARVLNHYMLYNGRYDENDIRGAAYQKKEKKEPKLNNYLFPDAASIYQTFEAMVEVSRPDEDLNWGHFASSGKIAWKTGTSFGHRDGWAIGLTPQYVVAVWAGNSSGEGRPGLTGIGTAAPILFDIFSFLQTSAWFDAPYDEMAKVPVCRMSGYISSIFCDKTDTVFIPSQGLKTVNCPYHQLVHLDDNGFRVDSDCESTANMKHVPWFVLPPAMEWYYKFKNPGYQSLPPYRRDCSPHLDKPFDFIYPRENNSKVYVPREIDGKPGKVVFEAAHRQPGMKLFWHLDGEYSGSTTNIHQFGLTPAAGQHIITIVNEDGASISRYFEVLSQPAE